MVTLEDNACHEFEKMVNGLVKIMRERKKTHLQIIRNIPLITKCVNLHCRLFQSTEQHSWNLMTELQLLILESSLRVPWKDMKCKISQESNYFCPTSRQKMKGTSYLPCTQTQHFVSLQKSSESCFFPTAQQAVQQRGSPGDFWRVEKRWKRK